MDFEGTLERLKEALHVHQDQEVAEALGLTKHSLSDRKKRGSLPVDKIRALCGERGFDAEWILTGREKGSGPDMAAFGARVMQLAQEFNGAQAIPIELQRVAGVINTLSEEKKKTILGAIEEFVQQSVPGENKKLEGANIETGHQHSGIPRKKSAKK